MTSIRRNFFGLAVSSILLLSAGAAFATTYKYTSFDYPSAIGTYRDGGTHPFGINTFGQIVGRYEDTSNWHGFKAAPIRSPSFLRLLLDQ